MRHSYDSFDYWEGLISKHKTIRSHMFMDKPPTKKSFYIHTLVFSKKNGLNNEWGYFPDEKALLGYIQYSFLQEAFYKWIFGRDKLIVEIPNLSVDAIINDGEKKKLVSKDDVIKMRKHLQKVRRCWHLPKDELIIELFKFAREFNRNWAGDSTEFLYLKVFKTAEELGNFVISSSSMTERDDSFIDKTGMEVEEWKSICRNAIKNKNEGLRFRDVLLKSLTEII